MTSVTTVATPLPAASEASGRRLAGLDGLRGIAALVVLAYHAGLTWPALYAQTDGPHRGSKTFWLTYSPLHLLWAGHEAVSVFFILSGFVLVLPYLKARNGPGGGTWTGYLARRLFRLYPPVIAALVVSAALVAIFPRTATVGVTPWYQWHNVDLRWSTVIHDMVLVDGNSMINSVLWSLRWEVWFSLLLPLVVVAARRMPRQLWLTFPVSIALVEVGQHDGTTWSMWMPVFLVGVVLAVGRDDLRRCSELIESISSSVVRVGIWWLLVLTSGGLLLAEWVLRLAGSYGIAMPLTTLDAPAFVCTGGALACFVVLGWPAAERVFSGRFLQWAGAISFSLYLVHEPVVVSVSGLLGSGTASRLSTIALGGGVSVLLAAAFHRLVEAPSTRLARDVGRAVDRALDRRRRPRAVHLRDRHDTAVPVRPALPPLPLRPRVPADGRRLVDSR